MTMGTHGAPEPPKRGLLRRLARPLAGGLAAVAVCIAAGVLAAVVLDAAVGRSVVVALYIGGAVGVVTALVGRSTLMTGVYGEFFSTDAVRESNRARALNLALGVLLLVIASLVDTLDG